LILLVDSVTIITSELMIEKICSKWFRNSASLGVQPNLKLLSEKVGQSIRNQNYTVSDFFCNIIFDNFSSDFTAIINNLSNVCDELSH